MSKSKHDPTESIREKAASYPAVDTGTACTQSSFKTGKKAFLYIGEQGGRFKAMFKLEKSLPQATKLAEKEPDRFEVGNTSWVTTRFTAEEPIPKRIWEKWLDESYGLCVGDKKASGTKKATGIKKSAGKKSSKKS